MNTYSNNAGFQGMYKIMIHIKNESTYIDVNVCVQIELPAVPRKGDTLYLDNDLKQVLEDKAKSNLEVARGYAPKWFYGHSYDCKEPKQENLQDLSFHDATNVDSVAFNGNSEIIHIELDS